MIFAVMKATFTIESLNVNVFIAQLLKASLRNREAMGSNPGAYAISKIAFITATMIALLDFIAVFNM